MEINTSTDTESSSNLTPLQEELLSYCLSKTGSYVDHPFGDDSYIVKVRKKIFAQLFSLKGVPMITLNGDALTNNFYRQRYPDYIKRGYHCPPVQQPYFNTINLECDIPKEEILSMIDNSYKYVVGKLPKKVQKEISAEAGIEEV